MLNRHWIPRLAAYAMDSVSAWNASFGSNVLNGTPHAVDSIL